MIAFVLGVIRAATSSGIEIQRHRVDVGEHRRRAGARDRLGGRVERERRADDLVARYPVTDAHRLEREDERVGAVRDADRVRHAEKRGGLALERLDLGPEDEPPRLEHAPNALLELGDQRRVLRLDVDERDRSSPAGRVYSRFVSLGSRRARVLSNFHARKAAPATSAADDRVVDVAERVVEVLPARAGRPAGAREGEAPDRRADAA